MAVVSRVATLRLDDNTTHTTNVLQWVATATIQDTDAGLSVDITTVRTTVGIPPDAPTTLTLNLYTDAGTLIRAFTLDTTISSQVSTFHFTSDGTSTGTPRADTVEIAIRATRTSAVTYDVETDATPNTPPTGFDSHLDRGWVRGTTTSTTTISNISLGGIKSTPAEYDESLFVRTTLGAALYRARALTVAVSGATPALSAVTNSTTTGNFDVTLAGVVDDRFPAAVTTVSTSLTVPNATLTGLPATVLTATNDNINVDPRRTASLHLWQADDDVFGTPPMSKHDASKSALTSSYSGLAMRLVGSRGTPINGISVTITLDPRSPGSTITRSSTTATRGGEAGWTDLAQLGPFVVGGAWDATLTVTAPADADAPGYVLSNTDTVTILSPDPRIVLRGSINKLNDQRAHFSAGDSVVATLTILDLTTRVRIDPSRVTEPKVAFVRYVASTHQLEYLDPSGTWLIWEPASAASTFDLTPSPNDARNYIIEFSNTSSWIRDIMAAQFSAKVDGTPYSGFIAREETGTFNEHSGAFTNYGFDPIAFAMSGVVSQR